MELLQYRKNIYSQNGEDGVIEEVLKRLDIKEGKFVEFGAWDGIYLSNTYNLLKNKNWSGFYIEADKQKYDELKKLKDIYGDRIITANEFVGFHGETKLDFLIKKYTDFDINFDLLSIDIDSFDYQVWESLLNYKPIIVIIEVNSSIWPPREQVHVDHNTQGSSIISTIKLGKNKGYTLICHTGNCIFIRDDFIDKINLDQQYLLHPEKLHIKM